MSRERLANAYEELAALHARVAEQYAQVAHELMGTNDQPGPAASVSPPARAAAPVQSVVDQGECPAHHREWKMGNYGPYCTAKSDDPAWSNSRGYCKLTPDNAPQYLRIQAAGAAA